jgi:hypothetical protein
MQNESAVAFLKLSHTSEVLAISLNLCSAIPRVTLYVLNCGVDCKISYMLCLHFVVLVTGYESLTSLYHRVPNSHPKKYPIESPPAHC